MATIVTQPERRTRPPAIMPVALVALAVAAHWLPTDIVTALDRLPPPPRITAAPGIDSADVEANSFPGSAYFLAEDAFAPAPLSTTASPSGVVASIPPASSRHVLQIETGPAALSMPLRAGNPLDQARALQCLTNAIYYEAANEPEEGQRAVAQVVLNRVASGRWPPSICGTIYQGGERSDRKCQFTFSCDGSMARPPSTAGWARARRVAWRAMSGEVFAPVGLATFYHTLAVHPSWADSMRQVAIVGAHIFYRLPGPGGEPAAYRYRYTGREDARPGPFAFTPPPRPVAAPPGPQPAWLAAIAPMPQSLAPPGAFGPPPQTPWLGGGLPGAPHRDSPPAGDSRLPQSTIRPEYRDSGRPLQ